MKNIKYGFSCKDLIMILNCFQDTCNLSRELLMYQETTSWQVERESYQRHEQKCASSVKNNVSLKMSSFDCVKLCSKDIKNNFSLKNVLFETPYFAHNTSAKHASQPVPGPSLDVLKLIPPNPPQIPSNASSVDEGYNQESPNDANVFKSFESNNDFENEDDDEDDYEASFETGVSDYHDPKITYR